MAKRPPYRGNQKLKGPSIPGATADMREPDRTHRGGYDTRVGNEVADYDDVTVPGKNLMSEVSRVNKKKRSGRFTAIEAAHALACRSGGGGGGKSADAFFKSVGYK